MASRKEALTRRTLLTSAAAAAASTLLPRRSAHATSKAKLKIGLLLPFSGTYAALGASISDGMKLAARDHQDHKYPCQVFGTAEAIRIAPRCRTAAYRESQPQGDCGGCVGKVVDGVSQKCD